MTNAEKLHRRLNALIATDTRPVLDQDTVSRHTGHKRSTIKAAASGAAPVKELYETLVANMGTTTKGTLLTGPIDPVQFHQLAGVDKGQGATCWVLGPGLSLAIHSPSTLPNNFVPIDSENVMVLGIWQGIPVAMHTSLEVSTAYNQGTDVRPELLLKFVALLRSATWQSSTGADMANDDYGSASTTLALVLGTPVTNSVPNLARDGASLAAGKVVCLSSVNFAPANAPAWYVVNHVFVPKSIGGGQSVMEQSWYGGTDFIVTQAQYEDPKYFNLAMTAAIPSPLLVSAAAFGIVTQSQSIPTTPAAKVPIMTPITFTPMDLTKANKSEGKLETQGGTLDVGFLNVAPGGTCDVPFVAPVPGKYLFKMMLSSDEANTQVQFRFNGQVLGPVVSVVKQGWAAFVEYLFTVDNVPAGTNTVGTDHVGGGRYNVATPGFSIV